MDGMRRVLPPGVIARAAKLNRTHAFGEIELEVAVTVGQNPVGFTLYQDTRDRLAGEGVQHDSAYWVEDGGLPGWGQRSGGWPTGYCCQKQMLAAFGRKAQVGNPLLSFAFAEFRGGFPGVTRHASR